MGGEIEEKKGRGKIRVVILSDTKERNSYQQMREARIEWTAGLIDTCLK